MAFLVRIESSHRLFPGYTYGFHEENTGLDVTTCHLKTPEKLLPEGLFFVWPDAMVMSLSHHRTKAAVREPLLARFLAQLGTSQAVAADLVPWQRSPQSLLSMMNIFWLVSIYIYTYIYMSLSFPPPMPWFLSCDLPILLI